MGTRMKKQDHTGKDIGNFHIIRQWSETSRSRKDGRALYFQMCEARCLLCGSVKTYRLNNITSGHTQSCGCTRHRLPDLTGNRFGLLTVLKKTDEQHYLCQCDCGKQINASASKLFAGSVVSCGCKRSGLSMLLDEIGKTYGDLTVEGRVRVAGNWMYKCKCKCGNTRICTITDLKRGRAVSCGCRQEQTNRTMRSALEDGCVEYTNLHKIKNCNVLPKNNRSGVRGVCYNNRKKRWLAYIGINKTVITLGNFQNFDDAVSARKEAERIYYKPLLDEYGMSDTPDSE